MPFSLTVFSASQPDAPAKVAILMLSIRLYDVVGYQKVTALGYFSVT